MTAILAIDTSTECCSAALNINGNIISKSQVTPQQHTRLILPMIEALLLEADLSIKQLSALAFGSGPGSFTGLRIASGVIQGLAFAADLPVVPISTLRALAQSAYREHQANYVLAAIDARMQEIYWGAYAADSAGIMQAVAVDTLSTVQAIQINTSEEWLGVGSGWKLYNLPFPAYMGKVLPEVYPQAHDIAYLAQFDFAQGMGVSAEFAQPVYLRNNVAKASCKSG